MYLGIDLGSSSLKLSLFDPQSETYIASVTYPETELAISTPFEGWAEQDPEMWWHNFMEALRSLKEKGFRLTDLKSIGISYQMHGLVLVDKDQQVLRPSIIWCDSRAVAKGEEAFNALGTHYCSTHLLNAPGNFTASKLAWVKEFEPEIYSRIHKIMLPGDYLAMRLTGKITTTNTGLSEGIFWDFSTKSVSNTLLKAFDIEEDLIPEQVNAIGAKIKIQPKMAEMLGLSPQLTLSYRCGDQPNNAFSLDVLEPGEVAATAGTSGVIYAVTDTNISDEKSRINTFLHVNDTDTQPRNGVLICVNGTGILYSWLKRLLTKGPCGMEYEEMNSLASKVEPGSEGLMCMPFGNGAERIFQNQIIGSHFSNINFNVHTTSHIIRSGLEGIVYAMNAGLEVFKELGGQPTSIRAGQANLFLSPVFREIFVNVTGTRLEIYNTDGAAGAARGAALGDGFYQSTREAFDSLEQTECLEPDPALQEYYQSSYLDWIQTLNKFVEIK